MSQTNLFSAPHDWNQAMALSQSAPAAALASGSGKKADLAKAAADYAALAQSLGVPPELWGLRLDGPGFMGSDRILGALRHLLNQSKERLHPAAETLFAAGANPWIESATRHHHTARTFLAIDDGFGLSRQAMGYMQDPARSKLLLRMSLQRPPNEPRVLSWLLDAFDARANAASPTASGVLGPADQLAKGASDCLLFSREPLLEFAATLGPEPLARAQAALDRAQRLLDLKSQAAPAAEDPEALRKAITKEQRARLSALSILIAHSPQDRELIEAALNATAWLQTQPLLSCLACLNNPRQGVLLAEALAHGSLPALEFLDRAGANIWLAAAQSHAPDAALWALALLLRLKTPIDPSPVARMLLRGAWLSGAPNPQSRCVEILQQALSQIPDERSEERSRAGSLLSAVERENLDEIIASSAAPASSRRASSL